MNEDRDAPNYDPQHKIIKSLFNGSKGPVLRAVTPVDWDGPNNASGVSRFNTSTNIRGDHPLNLLTTTLAAHAYLLTHDAKYKRWLLEYVDAWRDRTAANGGNVPRVDVLEEPPFVLRVVRSEEHTSELQSRGHP